MSLFLRFFKRKEESSKSVRHSLSVEDLLGLDYHNIPDGTFERRETIVNESGRPRVVYVRNMESRLINLFSRIEVRFGLRDDRVISFFSKDADAIDIDRVEWLVNSLYDIYGKDNSYIPKGVFNRADKVAIKRKSWAGRLWIHNSFQPKIILSMDAERLELTVLAD